MFRSIRGIFSLEGKKSIVTGGGSGIGAAVAYGLAEYGSDVAVIGRNSERLEDTKNQIEKIPRASLAIQADVSRYDEVTRAVDTILSQFGRVDILVNSHGIGQWVDAEDITEKDWDTMIGINLKGVFLMSQAVGRSMIKNRYGKIINVSSVSGRIVNRPQTQAHYNTAKAGVNMLTKCLAFEWAKYNINVNSISPGFTLTPLVNNLLKNKPEYISQWKSLVPLGRFAEPYDMVGAVIFLASDASSYVTGHDLVVDGGYTIW
ncbi:MAG: glucose 1-dehydrogenase [Candidatus Bathyarchaeia archaeon]